MTQTEENPDYVEEIGESHSLIDIQNAVHQTAKEHGWHDEDMERSFGDVLMLTVSELSEALEEFRAGRRFEEVYFDDRGTPHGIPIEMADVLIRLLDICAKFEIPISWALHIKMEYNKTRSHRHGGKLL